MLILTRRPVETICIGEEVTVTVLGVVGNQVRFGIEAPRHIVIDRAEIHERKKRVAYPGAAAGNTEAPGVRRTQDPTRHADGNLLEEEATIAAHDSDRQPVNGNGVATLKLRRQS